jgi:hypothetical protein
MKSFKNHMAEVAEPKSSEEKKFKDLHNAEVKPHPVAEPTQHKAEKPKAKRKADQEGDANYDKAYTTENSEQIDEISRSMKPMNKRFGGTVIAKKFDAYKKFVKKNKVDEPTVRMICDNPDAAESKRMMKNKDIAQAVDLYKAAHKKESVNEVTQSAIKKPMNITGPDGKVRTVMKRAKDVKVDDHGQEKMAENKKADLMKKLAKTAATTKKGKEAVSLKKAPWEKKEHIDEAVKVGNMKLKDGSSMKVTKEDAKLLNQMFKGLNSQNRKQMEKVMMTDKSGFNEIVGFAREAM